jgi:CBS domain-containing protein
MKQENKEVSMQVSEIMHKGLTAVNVNESVRRVAELMREEDIGAVPIVENDRPVGFITDRDIVINCVASGSNLDDSVRNAMTEQVVCVSEDQSIEEATKLMKDNQISRILVVDKNKKPCGMVSLQDLTDSTDEEESAETLSQIKQ